jgi:hypothetical protein
MSFVLVGNAIYNDTTQRYELTPHQSEKSGSVILTGVAPCLNYKSVWDVLLSTPASTGIEQMSLFFCQIDKEVSVEIGIHHNAVSKSLTLSLSKTTDQGNSYSQSMKYVDNVDVTYIAAASAGARACCWVAAASGDGAAPVHLRRRLALLRRRWCCGGASRCG